MLRASSGKHARLVGVCPAAGDSAPPTSGDVRRRPVPCSQNVGFYSARMCFNLRKVRSKSRQAVRENVFQDRPKPLLSNRTLVQNAFKMSRQISIRLKTCLANFYSLKICSTFLQI